MDTKFKYVLEKTHVQEFVVEASTLDEAWEKVNADPDKHLVDEGHDESSNQYEIDE